MRRPPSLSEGSIPSGAFDKLIPLVSVQEESPEEGLGHVANLSHVASLSPVASLGPVAILEYVLRFLFHLTLIAFFETLFFFKFVSKDEDNGILQMTDFYTSKLTSSCANFSKQESEILNLLLAKLVNVSLIETNGLNAAAFRGNKNNDLFIRSWVYFSGILGTFTLVALVAFFRKYRIHWRGLVIENMVFVSMLGMYEVVFFLTIIKKYMTISPEEISMGLISSLQQTCGLFIGKKLLFPL